MRSPAWAISSVMARPPTNASSGRGPGSRWRSRALKLGYFNPDAAAAARWTDVSLTPEHREYLAALPFTAHWRGALLVHASPSDPGDWNYVLSPADAEVEFQAFSEPMCFIGHSHFPGTFTHDGVGTHYSRLEEVRVLPGHRYLVNVPSVGQPRDGDPRAGYLLHDTDAARLRHVRLEYDVAGARKRILEAGLPPFLADRLQWGE
jgi:diadenosine tetraphosphatase ApaH/serine/threonine PP2A family protein phosphatase